MKKIIVSIALVLLLVGCGSKKSDDKSIKIMATSVPHAEVLEYAKPILKDKYGINLEIVITDDYYIPNKALDTKDIDANYFQSVPFLDLEIKTHNYKIERAGDVHIEPIGIYSNKYKSIKDVKKGATIIISNSPSDHGRVLAVLQKAGLIKLDSKVDPIESGIKDIVENKLELVFKADVAPTMLVRSFQNDEADLVAINANYALDAGLNPGEDPIFIESSDNNPYVNVVVVGKGQKDEQKFKDLVSVLQSKEVQDFIKKEYKGAVVGVK